MRVVFLLSTVFLLSSLVFGCAGRSSDQSLLSSKLKTQQKSERDLVMLSPDLSAPSEPPLSDFFAHIGKQTFSRSDAESRGDGLLSLSAQRKALALQEILRKRKKVSYKRDGRLVIGLLLPQKSFPALANRMEQAARFALKQDSNFSSVKLFVRDSGTASSQVERAAASLFSSGADIIIGPIFASQSHPASVVATRSRRPMISFSNDSEVRGDFAYRFGLSVGEQTTVALADGLSRPPKAFSENVSRKRHAGSASDDWVNFGRRVAIIAMSDVYGHLVAAEGNAYLRSRGLSAERVDFLDKRLSYEVVDGEIRNIADYDYRQLALSKRRKNLRSKRAAVDELSLTAQNINKELKLLEKQDTYGAPPFDILLLPQSSRESLQVVSSYLALYDIDSYSVNIYGLSTWGQMSKLWREPQLQGSRYVFPARASLADFTQRFHSYIGSSPSLHILTALAYDATLTAARLGARAGFVTREALERKEGFVGAAGRFRFRPDGDVQRVYEIREITREGDKTLARAQKNFLP